MSTKEEGLLEMQAVATVGDLPFVKVEGKKTNFWHADDSGVWALDNKIGRTHADEAVLYMRDKQAPSLLGSITQAMINGGRFGGVEVGFMNRIATHAMRGRGSS